MLQLEGELESIERVVRKVELANERSAPMDGSAGILLTSVSSAIPGQGPLQGVESVRGHRAANMVELIQQFNDLSATIERLSTKVMTVQVDFPTTDFPKEISDRLDKLARYDACRQALEVKDHMLWTVLQERDQALELLGEEKKLSQNYASELTDWAAMAQQLIQQNEQLKAERVRLGARNHELIQVLADHNIVYVPSDEQDDDGESEGGEEEDEEVDDQEE